MDKILQSVGSRDGGISVTNDGATILRSIHVDNAAAKVLVNIAKTQVRRWSKQRKPASTHSDSLDSVLSYMDLVERMCGSCSRPFLVADRLYGKASTTPCLFSFMFLIVVLRAFLLVRSSQVLNFHLLQAREEVFGSKAVHFCFKRHGIFYFPPNEDL